MKGAQRFAVALVVGRKLGRLVSQSLDCEQPRHLLRIPYAWQHRRVSESGVPGISGTQENGR